VFHITIWGLGALFGGLSPPKTPGSDGTGYDRNQLALFSVTATYTSSS